MNINLNRQTEQRLYQVHVY